MKWSPVLFGSPQVQISPAGVELAAPVTGRHYASLDNDVNTPDRREPLASGLLGAIYDELVELAWKNLEFGEKA
jgi:hypothetical protein